MAWFLNPIIKTVKNKFVSKEEPVKETKTEPKEEKKEAVAEEKPKKDFLVAPQPKKPQIKKQPKKEKAIDFHLSRGRSGEHYIAYLQAGTNTYSDTDTLQKIYKELLSHPKVSGLIIGTRPDCISSEILDILEDLSHSNYIAVEYGIESVYDTTLQRVNRGHDFQCAIDAVAKTSSRGLDVGGHFIIGLPGENREDIISGITKINALNLDFIKFHQLQIYRSTPMAREWVEYPERFALRDYTAEDYVDLMVDIIRRLDPSVAIERFASQAPRHLLVGSMLGGIKLDRLRAMIVARMRELGAVQGDMATK